MNIVNAVRIVAALLAALRWFMSAHTKLTRVRAGLEELDKATQLADDLQMGKVERRRRGFCLHCGGGGCADRPRLKLTLFEPVQAGRIYIEKITSRSCTSSRAHRRNTRLAFFARSRTAGSRCTRAGRLPASPRRIPCLHVRRCAKVGRFQVADSSKSASCRTAVSIVQVDFRLATDVAATAPELKDWQPDRQRQPDDKLKVEANDNGLQWPFIPFPEDWYASF